VFHIFVYFLTRIARRVDARMEVDKKRSLEFKGFIVLVKECG
jgi:hypothetical protein